MCLQEQLHKSQPKARLQLEVRHNKAGVFFKMDNYENTAAVVFSPSRV